MVTFAALRFAEDGNLFDRTYWYRCDFALSPGERVLAPVGMHDRLQRAVVERVLEAGAENAPYDLRLIKSVAARDGARLLRAGGAVFRELGGIRYDRKHYTRFGRVLVGMRLPSAARAELSGYGVSLFCDTEENGAAAVLRTLSRERGCTLIFGDTADMVGGFLLLHAGVPADALPPDIAAAFPHPCGHGRGTEEVFADMGLTGAECSRLREKLR